MKNKFFEINKYITLENDTYEITLTVKTNGMITEKVSLVISRVNDIQLYYTYETTRYISDEFRYTQVIQEAIQQFKDDQIVQQFINWDGKLQYKISL